VRSLVNATGLEPDTEAHYRLTMVVTIGKGSRDRDCDSNVKLVMDGIFSGLGVNDSRVTEIVLMKEIDRTCDSCINVTVELTEPYILA